MSLDYYRDLFQMAVCDMAKSSGKFSEKLRAAWVNYLYKINWSELEVLLMNDDLPSFKYLKKRLHDDLHSDIDKQIRDLIEKTADAQRPLTEADASKYVNAETVIGGMNGVRASKTVAKVVELYQSISMTLEYQRTCQSGNSR